MEKEYYTSVIRLKGDPNVRMVPVKSTEPMETTLFIECSKVLSRVYAGTPVKKGDIICSNILNTGIDIIATKSVGMLTFNLDGDII
ncbi:CxxC motif-containing protein [Youngiibacter multivorans]|uniref:CxxC motif-containing protein n=1 Tax=Youngiibacter multivorans TaxID=937251 RepID=A0ABS4G4Z3_9CLOT|nr:CxxC motif-containing protein [Youngiibacter multivorans]